MEIHYNRSSGCFNNGEMNRRIIIFYNDGVFFAQLESFDIRNGRVPPIHRYFNYDSIPNILALNPNLDPNITWESVLREEPEDSAKVSYMLKAWEYITEQAIKYYYDKYNTNYQLLKTQKIDTMQLNFFLKIIDDIKHYKPSMNGFSTAGGYYLIKDNKDTIVIKDELGEYDRCREMEKVLGL
jgi:hypothetical protein